MRPVNFCTKWRLRNGNRFDSRKEISFKVMLWNCVNAKLTILRCDTFIERIVDDWTTTWWWWDYTVGLHLTLRICLWRGLTKRILPWVRWYKQCMCCAYFNRYKFCNATNTTIQLETITVMNVAHGESFHTALFIVMYDYYRHFTLFFYSSTTLFKDLLAAYVSEWIENVYCISFVCWTIISTSQLLSVLNSEFQ